MLSLNRPDTIILLHDLKARANMGAKADPERARDALVQMREDAEHAKVMARSWVPPEPAELKAARSAANDAARAARAARTRAEAAAQALSAHRAAARSGWRRLLGWASGANDRHRAAETALAAAKTKRDSEATEAESTGQKAAAALTQAQDRHHAAGRSFREGWQAEAAHAAERIAAVEAALELLFQRPELARMGPSGLLKTGYGIADIRNRAALDQAEDVDHAVGGPSWP